MDEALVSFTVRYLTYIHRTSLTSDQNSLVRTSNVSESCDLRGLRHCLALGLGLTLISLAGEIICVGIGLLDNFPTNQLAVSQVAD